MLQYRFIEFNCKNLVLLTKRKVCAMTAKSNCWQKKKRLNYMDIEKNIRVKVARQCLYF